MLFLPQLCKSTVFVFNFWDRLIIHVAVGKLRTNTEGFSDLYKTQKLIWFSFVASQFCVLRVQLDGSLAHVTSGISNITVSWGDRAGTSEMALLMCLLYSHLPGILEGQLEGWLGLCPCSLRASPSPEYLWQEAAQRLQKFKSSEAQAARHS